LPEVLVLSKGFEKASMTSQRVQLTGFEIEEDRIRSAYARRSKGDRYSWFNEAHLHLVQDRERRVLATLKREQFSALESKQILEVGCGQGQWIRELVKWGARPDQITGVDLLPDRLEEARKRCPQGVRLVRGNALDLVFPSDTFDVVVQSTVFTSMLDHEIRGRAAAEMLRVVKPDGLILWYDFFVDNPWNPDVKGIRKREIESLFAGCRIRLRRCTLAPPLTRALAPYSMTACTLLSKMPWLCTHYLGTIRRKASLDRRNS
jgi:ubiquinone/menaquinone biosynthesis C-methylase UbiE